MRRTRNIPASRADPFKNPNGLRDHAGVRDENHSGIGVTPGDLGKSALNALPEFGVAFTAGPAKPRVILGTVLSPYVRIFLLYYV
jgi:hypothetical protein